MGRLNRLQDRLQRREKKHDRAIRGRRRQTDLARDLRKQGKDGQAEGHQKKAAEWGREMVKHQKAINKLERLIEKEKARRPKSGTGAWGGSKSIIVNEVLPVAREWGIPVTSGKRWETFGNPSSDHFMLNRTAFAKDFATDSNYEFGVAIGKALGIGYTGSGSDYASFYIERAGKTFRVQIICGTHGTGPHTHVGIRRA